SRALSHALPRTGQGSVNVQFCDTGSVAMPKRAAALGRAANRGSTEGQFLIREPINPSKSVLFKRPLGRALDGAAQDKVITRRAIFHNDFAEVILVEERQPHIPLELVRAPRPGGPGQAHAEVRA